MTNVTLSTEDLALSRAKFAVMSSTNGAFFTALIFGMHHEFDDTIPTACTNGRWVKYNRTFFMNLTHEERVFLILHEVMHGALMHVDRGENLDKRRFNIAADHVINLMLIERKFEMPACGLADPQYKDMDTETVYKLLPENCEEPEDGIGEDLVAPTNPEESKKIQREIEDLLIRAQAQSKMANDKPGTIPGDIQIFLNKLLDPKLPWNQILAKYLQSYAKNDYSFKKPNRRFFPQHHLPSLYSKSLIDLAVAVDTSGSVSDHDFLRVISETNSIIRMMKPRKMTFLQFDHVLQGVDEIGSIMDLMRVKFTGRGGTNIEPVFDWATKNKPQLLLIFSDGCFSFPDEYPKSDLLWLIHSNPQWTFPKGKVIHYEP